MELSLTEAARLLGKSRRQVRYLIQTGGLPAAKHGERWMVRQEDLPLSKGQRKTRERKLVRAVQIAEEVLTGSGAKKHYALLDLNAFLVGKKILEDLVHALGEEHAACRLMRESLMLLGCGYHEFNTVSKIGYLARSREQASRALVTVLLEHEDGGAVAEEMETHYLPKLGGLIRVAESRSKK